MDDNQNSQGEVVEAEVVEVNMVEEEGTSSPSTNATSDQVDVLFSLEEMIKNNIASLDSLREELKKQREMFEDVFINDETFRTNTEKAKEANKAKNTTRQQIMSQPAVAAISSKVKGIRSDIKERQGALSDYLQEYQRMTGATEIEGKDGELRDIINNSKVIKQASKKR
jgi:hypothetical protein